MEIKLEVYTFKVRLKGQKNVFEDLSTIIDCDFLDFILNFIQHHDKNMVVYTQEKRSFQIIADSLVVSREKRSASGLIESGDYGDETKIVTQKGKLKFTKSRDELSVRPFYFLIHIPKQGKLGYLILQRTGVYGINRIFQQSLNTYFVTSFPNHKLEIAQFLSKELVKEYINKGGIQEFILTRYNLPSDVTDKLDLTKISESVKGIDIRIFAKSGAFFGMNREVSNFLDNNNAYFFDSKPLKEMGFDNNYTISVKIKKGGKTRTIDLNDSGQLRPYYNVDNEVKKDLKTGYPVFTSINEVAKNLLAELVEIR